MNIRTHAVARSQDAHNFHHLVMNAMWFGVALAASTRFLSVFAIRLGATPLELGLLSALPGLMALATTTFLSQWWMRHFRDSVHAVILPALGLRLNFLLLALTGFLPPQWRPAWIIFSVSAAAFAEGISAVVFTVMLREAVPQNRLTALLSRRNIALNIVLGISILVFGYWLETAPFPANYQVMFAVGFLFTLVSLWHITRVRVSETASVLGQQRAGQTPSACRAWRSPAFQLVAFAAALIHVAFFSIVPVTPLRLVNELGAGEQFMALFGMVELIAAIAVSFVTSYFVEHYGNRSLIAVSMVGTGLAAFVLAFSSSLPLTLLAAVLSGAGWTAATIGLFGYFTENTAPQDMPRFTAAYTQVVYLAIFVGPLVGSSLANAGVNLTAVLLLGAVLRLLAGVFTSAAGALTLRRLAVAFHLLQ